MGDIEIVRRIKSDLAQSRRRIENFKDPEGKKKALEVYAELLESLEIGAVNIPTATR